MTDDELFESLTDAQLAFLEHRGPPPDLADVPTHLLSDVLEHLALIESLYVANDDDDAVEPGNDLQHDAVARHFGFERTGTRVVVDGRRVRRYRKTVNLDLKSLHAALVRAGADVTSAALFDVEQTSTAQVSPATASAMVAVFEVPLAMLEAAGGGELDEVRRFLDSPEFDTMIAEWTAEHGGAAELIRSRTVERVLAAQYRAERVDTAHLREIVQAVLRTFLT